MSKTYIVEPDVEQIREDAFKNGYDAACKDIDVKSKTNAAYRKGLEDAWECARQIVQTDVGEHSAIFGMHYAYDIFMKLTASEAIEKTRQYEQEIQVGDEVIGIYSSGEQTMPFVITKGNRDYYFGIYSHSGEFCQGRLKLQKTGRHFPEIAEVLKKMGIGG